MSSALHAGSDTPTITRPEIDLYHAGDVWITKSRLAIGNRTYWLRDINSLDVSLVSKGPLVLRELYFVPVPIFLVLVWIQADSGTSFGQILRVITFVALAALLVVAPFIFFRRGGRIKEPPRYLIKLNGKTAIYATTDGDYALWLARQVARAKEGTGPVEGYYPASLEIGPGEYVYYSDGVAAITSEQVILGKERFPLAAIRKGYTSHSPSVQYTQRWSLALAFMALNSMLNIIRQASPNFGRDLYLLWPGDFAIISGLIHLAVLGVMVWAFGELQSGVHTLKLRGSFHAAEWVKPFATLNQAYDKELVATINRAVSARKADISTSNATMPS